MTLYLCPECSGVLETEWIEWEDRYLHYCLVCGAEVDTEEMWKCAVMESDERYTRYEQSLDELDDIEE